MTDYTHDQNIANDTGANVRADINAMALALFSDSASASAPGTTLKSQRWNDYTNFLRKRRNQANSGWLVEGTLDESIVLARSSNTILGVSDVGKAIFATSTFTQTFTAVATLADSWWVYYKNEGTGVITLDPNSTETIDGATTISIYPGEGCIIYCNGSALKTIGLTRMTPWVAYTPTYTGCGTVSTSNILSRRNGDTLEIRGYFVTGTSTATEARMTLGFNGTNGGITADSTKVPTIQLAGPVAVNLNSAYAVYALIESGAGYLTFSAQSSGGNGLTKANGSQLFSTSATAVSITASIPITGW